MEIITVLVLAVSPFVVKGITNLWKKSLAVARTEKRVVAIKTGVTVFSFVIALANTWLTETDLDPSMVENTLQTLVFTLVTYFGAQGSYLTDKQG